MPILPNSRHEQFAQELAKGKTADEAYQAAGFKPNRGNAARLKANESILNRVEQIRAIIAEKAEWSAADRLSALKRISDASEINDPRVAVSAIAEANKMQGTHAPSKQEVTGKGGGPIQTIDLTKLSGDELAQLESIFGSLAGSSDDDAFDQAGES